MRFSAILAQALAKSEEDVHPSANAPAKRGPAADAHVGTNVPNKAEVAGLGAFSATAEAGLPAAVTPPSLVPTNSRKTRDVPTRGLVARAGTADPAQYRAANESTKKVRQAVLFGAIPQRRPTKGVQIAQFTAGVAVGCLALAAIGGGLVATGRLRFNTPSRVPSAGFLGKLRSTIEMPAASGTAGPVLQRPEAPRTSPPSAATPSPQVVATGQRSLLSRPSAPSSTVRLAVNRPVAEPNATPGTGNCLGPIPLCRRPGATV